MAIIESIAALLTVLAVSKGQTQNPGQQGSFTCPQPNGQFEYRDDCSKFWKCDDGAATLSNCQTQFHFNPSRGDCDWPNAYPNPRCTIVPDRSINSAYVNLCQNTPNGVDPTQAFHVGHPEYCNAFFTCAQGFLFSPCVFCGEGLFFNMTSGACQPHGKDPSTACRGKQMIEHADKVRTSMDSKCNPIGTNPFLAILNLLLSGGYSTQRTPTPTPYRG